jgi:putrescine transport system substrate-binding protein
MHKITRLAATAALCSFAVTAEAQEKVVNVYNWSDYIDEEILTDFTAETGIKVVYDVYDSNEILETKLLAGGSGYDVVVPTATFLQRQIQAGVYQKLQKDKLPNLKYMWPQIMERLQKYDPGNEHAVNYMWGTTGIGYNVEAVKARLGTDTIESWDVIFKPEILAKFADCGVMMLDAPDEILRAAMNYLGLNPDSTDPDDYQKATDLLMTIRPSVQKFHSSEYINALANGDICIAVGWSGDILQARDRAAEANNGVTVEYAIPEEGALMWFDNMAIPADAPHVDEAHAFVNYMMRPEVAAKASNYVYYANGNLASKEFLNEDVIGDPAIYPPDSVVEKLYVVAPFDAKLQRTITRLWTQVRTGL